AGDGSVALNNVGSIYIVKESKVLVNGYSITAHKVGLVVAPGAVVKCALGDPPMVSSVGVNFLWVEGQFDATQKNLGISWNQVRYSRMHRVRIENSYSNGVLLSNSADNLLHEVMARNNGNINFTGAGIKLADKNCVRNTLKDIKVSNNRGNGIELNGENTAVHNSLVDVVAVKNGGHGIVFANSNSNVASRILASNNFSFGVYVQGKNNILSDVTSSNNGNSGLVFSNAVGNVLMATTAPNNMYGLQLSYSDHDTLMNLLAVNNSRGFNQLEAGDLLIADIATANNSYGIYQGRNVNNNRYTGLLKVGYNNVGDCFISPGSSPGLDDDNNPSDVLSDNIHNGLCVQQGLSNFGTATTGMTMANTFIGKITLDDAANGSDNLGAATFPNVPADFDWLTFDGRYRTWGVDGGPFPNANQQVMWSVGTGRIWDWSLRVADHAVRGVLNAPVTGNETLTHVWIGSPFPQNDTGCNALVPGSKWSAAAIRCESTFLRSTIEIFGDGVGNENGLCESNEVCLYTPNIGSYQGHGAIIAAGSIGDAGVIKNVTLLKYEQNGY
ncbi:MAG: hypothetical protein OEW08_11965, partial [Gammaproteobacteria bacterium]|nr:hypothetical protein [Gammaproteobacteria bacterium]